MKCYIIAIIVCISCQQTPNEIINSYIINMSFISTINLKPLDEKIDIYKGKDSTYCKILYSKHNNTVELKNFIGQNAFGDNLIFENNNLTDYCFRTNDTNVSYVAQFNKKGKIISELGTPIVFNELSSNLTKDSIEINMVLPKVIFKNLIVKCSKDGKNYQEYKLVNSSKSKYVNNLILKYTSILPMKNDKNIDPFICFYSIIEGLTIFDETRVYNDTLCTYIRNEYLK